LKLEPILRRERSGREVWTKTSQISISCRK